MFGSRLKKLRENMNISQRDLAKIISLSPSTVAMYELDKRNPDKETILKVSELFDVSTDYLLGKTNIENINKNIKTKSISKLPLLGTIWSRLPILSTENIRDYIDVPESINGDFALEIKGNSMIGAGILEGDCVICKEINTAKSCDIVVALHNISAKHSEATLKYFFENKNGPILRSANPAYSEIKINNQYKIAGIMVGLVRNFAPSYQTYKDFLSIKDKKEWTEVIEKATGYDITPKQLSDNLDMQWQMLEKMKKKD